MFRPRHAYRSPITNRYKGKAKGCPVFNNLIDINSSMVEQHDECLECLAKIKNRTDLYRTLADNNKPSNNVIKSLQRLSSSASNNRLKTCLQFLIIRVNEKSIPTPQSTKTTSTTTTTPSTATMTSTTSTTTATTIATAATSTSSTNGSGNGPLNDDSSAKVHGSRDSNHHLSANGRQQITSAVPEASSKQPNKRHKLHNHQKQIQKQKHNQLASPPQDQVSSTQDQVGPSQDDHDCQTSPMTFITSSDHDTSSLASWSPSYTSPPSPISSESSTSSLSSSSSQTSSSSCSSVLSNERSPSPLSSPDFINELKGPRLKLSEDKIRKIKKRPVLFDYYTEHSFASTPTTSSGCSPGQLSNTTQNSDQSRYGLSTSNMVIHMFQAPPRFVNNLKPCNLPTKPQNPPPTTTPPVPTKEMLNCAICGIKDRPPNISKVFGQNSCSICTSFFLAFLERPQQLYCAQDGDCLMTFDSRCQACWIKICLQKFDIEEEHRKTGQKYSPKLLSSPNVSLITIDTSLPR